MIRRPRTALPTLLVIFVFVGAHLNHAFVQPIPRRAASFLSSPRSPPKTPPSHRCTTRRYNFFKDAFSKAFENDRNLSTDKAKGQYDAPGEEFDDPTANVGTLTETQQRWREKVRQTGGAGGGAMVSVDMVEGTRWTLDLYLAGVPEKDPSNDLYGSRINISNRDKETGLSLPPSPSTSVTLAFLKDGVCRADPSSFTSGSMDGEWKLSDDGKILRFSLDQVGYTRRVETRGSIQNIAWTKEEERSIETSTTYSIPPGFVYGDVAVIPPRQPGRSFTIAESGVLRLEQESGLFGIASRMVACGKFEARRAGGEES